MSITIRTLSADECHALLASHHIGRLAYAYKQRVDIEPLHYVADGEWQCLEHSGKLGRHGSDSRRHGGPVIFADRQSAFGERNDHDGLELEHPQHHLECDFAE